MVRVTATTLVIILLVHGVGGMGPIGARNVYFERKGELNICWFGPALLHFDMFLAGTYVRRSERNLARSESPRVRIESVEGWRESARQKVPR